MADKIPVRTFVVLALMPLFFSSNIIFGRDVVELVEPWTLAFIRWFTCTLILIPFVAPVIAEHIVVLRQNWKRLLLLGFLGMWICGALVYLALKYTSATNGTLIYTSSPALIIFLEWMFKGRKVGGRELSGIAIAMTGVAVIIFRGSLNTMMSLEFNIGDLLFLLSAISWSIYSVLIKTPGLDRVPTVALFVVIAFMGAITLAPFTIVEIVYRDTFPTSLVSWLNIGGIILFASLIAFNAFQHGVKVAGSSIAGIFMYLLPVYGVGMAVFYLGEIFQPYHLAGILLVGGGIILATLPATIINRLKSGNNIPVTLGIGGKDRELLKQPE